MLSITESKTEQLYRVRRRHADHERLQPGAASRLGFALIFAWLYGVNPAVQGELLSHRVRVSAFSIAYSLCLALFGGTTPLVAAYLPNKARPQ